MKHVVVVSESPAPHAEDCEFCFLPLAEGVARLHRRLDARRSFTACRSCVEALSREIARLVACRRWS